MVIKRIIVYDSVESTMDIARELDRGDVVVALSQRRGRGRKGREWFSPRGGLYLTIVTERMSACRATIVSSVSIARALEKIGIKSSIKWPNDLYVENNKISGILSVTTEDKTLIGIGVNVRTEKFPPDLNATSIFLQGINIGIFRFLSMLIDTFLNVYYEDSRVIFEEWKRRLDLRNRKVFHENSIWDIVDVDENCQLIIYREGIEKRVSSTDDIKFL